MSIFSEGSLTFELQLNIGFGNIPISEDLDYCLRPKVFGLQFNPLVTWHICIYSYILASGIGLLHWDDVMPLMSR